MGPFETDRLILRRIQPEDASVLKELIYSDREVWGQYSGYGDNPELLDRAFLHHVRQPSDEELGGQRFSRIHRSAIHRVIDGRGAQSTRYLEPGPLRSVPTLCCQAEDATP